ncbi:MAG TPA: response regulator transcription factor [Actinomycetota bacterium]|nr:response regulator transcription factor [Actinomycetota bacterium]
MAEAQERIRILLGDEQSLFRQALRVVLEAEGDLEVVAEASDGLQAVAEAERTAPDVALIDVGLRRYDGIQVARMICERVPSCDVVIVSGQEDPDILEQALEAGARGYVSKASPLTELLNVTRAVHQGEVLVPQRMLGDLLGRLMRRRREQSELLRRISRLTRREREVLRLMAGGAGTEAIARTLVISPQTARTHIQNILAKLQVHSRLEAAALVNGTGILDVSPDAPLESTSSISALVR